MDITSTISTAAFRKLVDEALSRVTLVGINDILEIYNAELEGVQPSDRIPWLYAVIKRCLCLEGTGDGPMAALRRLRRSIVFEGVIDLPAEPYAAILRVLADACREGTLRKLEDKAQWCEAVTAAHAVRILSPDFPEPKNARDVAVVEAATKLKNAGAVLTVEDGRFQIDDDNFAKLAQSIDAKAAALGGLVIVHQVCGWLHETVPLDFGRYPVGRRFASSPSFPIGFVLQLGVKHLASPPAPEAERSTMWADLAKHAIDLCAIVDVEPYSNMEDIVLNRSDVPRYLANVSLYDHLFALRQWPPSQARDLLGGVTAMLDAAEMRARVGWDMADVLILLDAVLSLCTKPGQIITVSDLVGAGVPAALWTKLAPHFVHPLAGMNRSYVSPLDAGKAEFDFKPLFALPKNNFLTVTPGSTCIGFFEAVTRALRAASYPELENLLGNAIENVVANAFRAAGLNVTVAGEEYSETGAAKEPVLGECDVVVETPHLVTFVELKKKPLRRISAGGDAAAGLVDLNASLFAAQAQLARHEVMLLRCGEIRFKNNYVLELKGRKIVRIAMTWLDYGSPQDKYLLSQVFEVLLGVRLTTDHPKEGKKLAELNEAIESLEKEVGDLVSLGKNNRTMFMNCWFLSTPQLMLLLDGVNDDTQFEARLGKLSHLTYRTLDFYREFAMAREGKILS